MANMEAYIRMITRLKFFRSISASLKKVLPPGTISLLVALPLAGQTLEVKVVDPFSDVVTNATVAIGDQEVPTDDMGVATFSGLGPGPHSIVVTAPDFAAAIRGPSQVRGHGDDPSPVAGGQRSD